MEPIEQKLYSMQQINKKKVSNSSTISLEIGCSWNDPDPGPCGK